jgi:Fe2+ transport system protein FeoA
MTSHGSDTTTLSRLAPGERAAISHIGGRHTVVRQRLLELGMLPGTTVEFVRTAPLGDPIEIRLHGYNLTFRREDADAILVVRLPA